MKNLLITLLLTTFISCGNKQTKTMNSDNVQDMVTDQNMNESENYLTLKDMNLTDKEWQKILESKKSIEEKWEEYDKNEGGDDGITFSEKDLACGELLASKMILKYSWNKPSDPVYLSRIKSIFGIDLNDEKRALGNRLQKRTEYMVYITAQFSQIERSDESDLQYIARKNDYYFYRKDGLVFPKFQVVTSYLKDKENGNYYFANELATYHYHLNNYIFYGNKASLTWLINNDDGTLAELFTMFGYDKEDTINTRILDKADNKHLENTFASRDIYGDLDIREGLFETVTKHSTKEFNDYYSLLQDYGYSISEKVDDKIDREKEKMHKLFTQVERRKILAHVFNTLQPIYDKYNQQCLNGEYGVLDKYGIGIEDSFWNICFDDRELIKDFEAHDCYGLPFLKSFLEKLRKDSKFVNPENGELEPWIYNPWDVHPDEDDKLDAK